MIGRVVLAVVLVACGGDDGGAPVDAALDAPAPKDPCSVCSADQVCVQRFDGTCGLGTACVTTRERCAPDTCSPACEAALCPRPYQCQTRPACGPESAAAFTCYGP